VAATGSARAAVDPLVRVSGPSPFIRGCGDIVSRDIAYGNTEVEPAAAANPVRATNLIAAWQQDRRADGGSRGIAVGVSEDGGRTWSNPAPPTFTRCAGGTRANGGFYRSASDPWVSFGPDGVAYLTALVLDADETRNAVLVSTSRDGGATWAQPRALITESRRAVNDKSTVTADRTRPGVAYTVWNRSRGRVTETFFARTTDGGATWEAAHRIVPGSRGHTPIGHQIAVHPNGNLVLVYVRSSRTRLPVVVVASSTDAGTTWSPARTVASLPRFVGYVGDPFTRDLVRTGDGIVPDIAVDPRSGSVYVVWQATRAAGRTAIMLSRSDDGGASWTAPKAVNAMLRTQAFTPSVEVAADGAVAVTYFDFSTDSARTRPLPTSAWVTRSRDKGLSFASPEALRAEPFDLTNAPLVRGGRFVGDYQGLAAAGNEFHAVFAVATGAPGDRTEIVATTIR
jgi:hypothetical protein